MEPEVHIIEQYFRVVEHAFTMTNVQCGGRHEIDMLAFNPVNGKRWHVEVRIATPRSFALDYKDTLKPNGKPNKVGVDYYAEAKFNHPSVVKKVKEFFGDNPYFKLLVVWSVKNTDAYGQMFKQDVYFAYGVHVHFMSEFIEDLKRHVVKGSRDDILRLIELIALPDRESEEWWAKEIRRMKRAKTINI